MVEDCAQATGASWAGRPVGAWGDVGCFSFFPTKNLGGAGDGGAAVVFLGSGNSIVNEGLIQGGDAGGADANAGAGIWVDAGASVSMIVNLGTLRGGTGLHSYGIANAAGSIARLANAQGGSAPALTYYGELPNAYDTIISSFDTYGQLAVASTGSVQKLTFGIEMGDGADLSTHRYVNAITGVDAADITNERTVIRVAAGVVATLDANQSVTGAAWDVRILNFGEDMAEPQRALLDYNAFTMRSELASHDCNQFGDDGLCLGSYMRFSSLERAADLADASASLSFVAAKKIAPALRAGAFVVVDTGPGDTAGVKMTSRLPTFGGFLGYAAHTNGSGPQARIAIGYQRVSAEFERANLAGTASSVSASGTLSTFAVSADMGWGIAIQGNTLLTPYAGVVLSKASRPGYGEDASASLGPLRYDALTASQFSGVAGLRLQGAMSAKVSYRLVASVEHDFSYRINSFVLNDGQNTFAYASPVKPRKTRASGSMGMGYSLSKGQFITLDGFIRQYNYSRSVDYSLMLGFRQGF